MSNSSGQSIQEVTQYVIECRGEGTFLPYVDYQIVESWVKLLQDEDQLLLLLSDVLPEYFAKFDRVPSLEGVDKLVRSKIKDNLMHNS